MTVSPATPMRTCCAAASATTTCAAVSETTACAATPATTRGGRGDDTLIGSAGEDVFVFGPRDGRDRIVDFANNTDRLDLTAFDFSDIGDVRSLARETRNGTLIDLSDHGGGSVLLEDFALARLGASDFLI